MNKINRILQLFDVSISDKGIESQQYGIYTNGKNTFIWMKPKESKATDTIETSTLLAASWN